MTTSLIVGIKRGVKSGPLPGTLNIGPGGPINSDALREAIYRFATDVLAGNNSYPADPRHPEQSACLESMLAMHGQAIA